MHLYHSSIYLYKDMRKPQHSLSLLSLLARPTVSINRKFFERAYTSTSCKYLMCSQWQAYFAIVLFTLYWAHSPLFWHLPQVTSYWVISIFPLTISPALVLRLMNKQLRHWLWSEPFLPLQALFPFLQSTVTLSIDWAGATPANIFFTAIRGPSSAFSPAGDKRYNDKTLLFTPFDFTLTLKISIKNAFSFFFFNESDLMPYS